MSIGVSIIISIIPSMKTVKANTLTDKLLFLTQLISGSKILNCRAHTCNNCYILEILTF